LEKKTLWTYIISFGVILALILFFQWNPAFHGGGDNAVYMNMGRAIYEGKGLVQLHVSGTPPDYHIVPGYPVILAGFMAITGDVKAVILFKILSAICYWFFLSILTILLIKNLKISIPAASGIALFLALNPTTTVFWSSALSEAPFLLFFGIAILCLFKYLERDSWLMLIIGALLTVLSVYIRLVGVSFAVAIIIWLFSLKKTRAAVLFMAISAVLFMPWVLYVALNGEFAYIGQAGLTTIGIPAFAERVFSNAGKYLFEFLPIILFPSLEFPAVLRITIGLISTVLFIIGFVATLREREARLFPIIVLCFVPAYLVFHYMDLRYLGLIAAPIIYTLIRGVDFLLIKFIVRCKIYNIVAAVLLTVFVGAVLPSFAESIAHSEKYRKEWNAAGRRLDAIIPLTEEAASFYEALYWVAKNTPEDAVLISADLRIAYFISNRQGVYVGQIEGDDIWRKALKYGFTHIILDPFSKMTASRIYPAMRTHPRCFEPVFFTDEPVSVVFAVDTTRLRMELD